MSTRIKVNLELEGTINHLKYAKRLKSDTAFWKFAATEWRRMIEPYTPMLTGMLKDNVHIEPNAIIYRVPYARRQYYGTRFRFTKTYHPLAGAEWDVRAKPTQLPKLYQSLNAYVKSERLKLND